VRADKPARWHGENECVRNQKWRVKESNWKRVVSKKDNLGGQATQMENQGNKELASQLQQAKERSYSLFVDNIHPNTLVRELRDTFQQIEDVSGAYISKKNRRHTNKRFGFIRFDNFSSADKAIRRFHGSFLKGEKPMVNWARFGKEKVISDIARSDDPKLASKHLEPNIASNLKDSRVHRKCEKEHEYSCEDGDQIMNTHVKQSSATVTKGHMSKENVSWLKRSIVLESKSHLSKKTCQI
jgi:RNA recognition motif-containing protein